MKFERDGDPKSSMGIGVKPIRVYELFLRRQFWGKGFKKEDFLYRCRPEDIPAILQEMSEGTIDFDTEGFNYKVTILGPGGKVSDERWLRMYHGSYLQYGDKVYRMPNKKEERL